MSNTRKEPSLKEKLNKEEEGSNSLNSSNISLDDNIKLKIKKIKKSNKIYKTLTLIFSIMVIIISISLVKIYYSKTKIIYKEKYKQPSLAADSIVLRKHKSDNYHDILLVIRGNEPYKGNFAFPGGFINYGEDPKVGCLRELNEETGLVGNTIELFTVRGEPKRDPRKHVVSIIYLVTVSEDANPIGGDDAKEAKFYNMKEIYDKYEKQLAFDHYEIIKTLIETKFKQDYIS